MTAPLIGFWIKSHSAILENVTIATLPDNLWRRFHELKLLVAYDSPSGDLPQVKDISFRLRVPETQLVDELGKLAALGLILVMTDVEGCYRLPHFREEQSPDSEAKRKRRQREKERKSPERHEDVTIRDTDKRIEDETRLEKKHQRDIAQGEPALTSHEGGLKQLPKRIAKPLPDEDPDFMSFWKAYPRKVDKPAAFKAWQKANRPAIDEILSALKKQTATQWITDEKKFIPYPEKWIAGERWNDQVPNQRSSPFGQ